MQTLANGHINTLTHLKIYRNQWFRNGREDCLIPMLVVLERQTQLKYLEIKGCGLDADQWNQISAVALDKT